MSDKDLQILPIVGLTPEHLKVILQDRTVLAMPKPLPGSDLETIIADARDWSGEVFGPGTRLKGIIEHIKKELVEVEEDPTDISEWVDIIILAIDGAWRNTGLTPETIVKSIIAKYETNRKRSWPDWRTRSQDEAIEHIRD